jgi:hypothetical protein
MTQGKLAVLTGADGVKRVAANLADVTFTQPDVRKQVFQPRKLDDVERDILRFVRGAQ